MKSKRKNSQSGGNPKLAVGAGGSVTPEPEATSSEELSFTAVTPTQGTFASGHLAEEQQQQQQQQQQQADKKQDRLSMGPVSSISTQAAAADPSTKAADLKTPVSAFPWGMPLWKPHDAKPPSADVVKSLLVHLYSPNDAYRSRALDVFYHPTLSTYSDPLVSVHGRDAIRSLFHLYFHWFVASCEVDLNSITTSPLSTTAIGAPGHLLVADYTLRITEYTLLGKILHFFFLLPPLVYFANAPQPAFSVKKARAALSRKMSAVDVSSQPASGLRILSKFHWVEESLSPASPLLPGGPPVTGTRGFVLTQEDVYSVASIVSYVLSIPLMFVSSAFGLLLSILNTLISLLDKAPAKATPVRGLKKSLERTVATMTSPVSAYPPVSPLTPGAGTIALFSKPPTVTETYFKEPLGYLLTHGVHLPTWASGDNDRVQAGKLSVRLRQGRSTEGLAGR